MKTTKPKPTKEEIKERFINERTRIISKMLDNPDEYGIYPTTKCFNALDKVFNELSQEYAEAYHKEKLREELIKFAGFITDEYLKTKE